MKILNEKKGFPGVLLVKINFKKKLASHPVNFEFF
jgi:hypothetical protein